MFRRCLSNQFAPILQDLMDRVRDVHQKISALMIYSTQIDICQLTFTQIPKSQQILQILKKYYNYLAYLGALQLNHKLEKSTSMELHKLVALRYLRNGICMKCLELHKLVARDGSMIHRKCWSEKDTKKCQNKRTRE